MSGWDESRTLSRMDVDLVATMQLLGVFERGFEAGDEDARFAFSVGYSVGRLFSSVQNLATLEEKHSRRINMQKAIESGARRASHLNVGCSGRKTC